MTKQQFKKQLSKIESLLFGFAMKLTRNRENAKDLMQETLMRCYDKKDRFKVGTNFKAWATTVMYNAFINHYRKRKTRNQVEQPIEDVRNVAESRKVKPKANSVIMLKELQTLVRNLPDSQRLPFEMMVKGYHYDEIAKELNVLEGTVKSRIFYARKKLKAMVNDLYAVHETNVA